MTFFFLFLFSDGVSPVKSHAEANQRQQPHEDQSNHQGTSRPTWLLALEVVTGVMVGSLFLVALLTAIQKCNTKSSLIIPWKKSASEKEHVSVYIGQYTPGVVIEGSDTFSTIIVTLISLFFFSQIPSC